MARCYYGPIFPKTGYIGKVNGQMFQNNPAVGINNKFKEVRDR